VFSCPALSLLTASRCKPKRDPQTSVDVLLGAALVQGIAYLSTATVALTVAANGAGNPRIDTVILRADYALQTIRLVLKQGTAARPDCSCLDNNLLVSCGK